MELLKRYIDYDFIFWPSKLNFENFKMFKYLQSRLKIQKPFMKTKKSTCFKFLM